MASREILDEIRQRLSIVRLIGEYVPLKRSGRNHKGLCPFHQEKTPSFMVTDEKQIFHCFGCGAGGDIFTFLMKLNGLDFAEALQELARRAGVTLPPSRPGQTAADQAAVRRRKAALQINQTAHCYFVQRLADRSAGKGARDYLQRRGLQTQTIERYGLGCADAAWEGLTQTLQTAKAPLALAAELGLIRASQKNRAGFYDFFRERIIFPIHNAQGEIFGFGGRSLGEAEPKYLNSADSLLYHKSKMVYGLHFAKEAIRQKDMVFLVEGYIDCLSLWQGGIENAVAPLGTALTVDQIQILSRLTKNFTVAFDGDAAGMQAAFRALPVFLELGLTPKAIPLPPGMDPDNFIQQQGAAAWEGLQVKAPLLFEYFVDETIRQSGNDTAGKVKAWEKIRPLLARVTHPVEAGLYRKKIAERLGLEESWLKEGKVPRGARLPAVEKFPQEEQLLIAAMVLEPKTIPLIQEAGASFTHPALKETATQLFEQFADKGTVTLAAVQNLLDASLARWIRELALAKEETIVWERAVRDCLSRMASKNREQKIQILNREIAAAENQGDEQNLLTLLQQKARLLEEKTV